MGYNAGGTYFGNHRSSGFDTVANDVSCVVELTRSKRQAGGMMQTTGNMEIDAEGTLRQMIAACEGRYRSDKRLIPNLDDTFHDAVEHCPCTLNQARNDPLFMMDTMFRPSSNCYIQILKVSGVSAGGPISYGQQCCYHMNG